MIKKYVARRGYSAEIKTVEIERETKSSVWVRGRRRSKISNWECYSDIWQGAHSFLMADAERELASARLQLERAQGKHGNIKGMKPPVDTPTD